MTCPDVHAYEVEAERWEAELGERASWALAFGEKDRIAFTVTALLPDVLADVSEGTDA